MSTIVSRDIRLASRPQGIPTAANCTLARTQLAPLKDQEVLVRTLLLSVDPHMRGRIASRERLCPVSNWLDQQGEFEKEVGGLFKEGKLKNHETVVKRIDRAVIASIGLLRGKHVGKMVVEL